eukprot:g9299.t1 g9299   contig36:293318-294363(-)
MASSARWLLGKAGAASHPNTIRIRSRLFSTTANDTSNAPSPQTPHATQSPYVSGPTTHFGYESVSVADKEQKVREVFEKCADNYDVMNDFMSAGLHRYWKDELLKMTGVGPMAKAVRRRASLNYAKGIEMEKNESGEDGDAKICDINPEMLRVGEARARKKYGSALLDESKALSFVEGNAQYLPFEDDSFDVYTIAFGLRNVTDVDMALRDALRVLKPGGRFLCLEFSHVTNIPLAKLYDLYSFNVIPTLGEVVANDRDSYQYLVESIRKFCTQEELVERMKVAGFEGVKYTNMTSGIVAVHEGWKPL